MYMKYFILLFIFFPVDIFAEDNNCFVLKVSSQDNILRVNEELGVIENLSYKNIKEIHESNLLGDIVDVYLPNRLMNCYIFNFKKGTTVYQIAALSENDSLGGLLENIDLAQFIAIGYYGILYSDREKINMFRGPTNQTPFDFLNDISPENYVSIYELEIIIGVNLNLVDKGGFLSPFYLFRCNLENGALTVLASPSEDKTKSFYMGGWSFER